MNNFFVNLNLFILIAKLYCTYMYLLLADSVEEGEKIVNAAVDKFGRIGETLLKA